MADKDMNRMRAGQEYEHKIHAIAELEGDLKREKRRL